MSLKGPFTLSISVNIRIYLCVKFQQCVYSDVDIDKENRHRTCFLHFLFVAIASIIFENANADVDAKCKWAFTVYNTFVLLEF